jgi:ubiquinone/menaquinone biosynthesis C-methylase UbiE
VTADVWSQRAELYAASDAHREGDDLELLVAWAAGASTALDVATGGGHVARRLREAGLDVVTCDPAPGMHPDVVCSAEELPFADGSSDVVACRTAAHHFSDVQAAMRELARVARDRVLLVDTLNMGDAAEKAERLRDRSHVRNYTEAEWRDLVLSAGLEIEEVREVGHEIDFRAWLERTGCAGPTTERVRELWGARVSGYRLTLDKIAIRARKVR